MKKIIVTLISGLFLFSTYASAEIGVNIGISGTVGIFGASAKEKLSADSGARDGNSASDTEIAAIGYGSVFLEKEFGMFSGTGILRWGEAACIPLSVITGGFLQLILNQGSANDGTAVLKPARW